MRSRLYVPVLDYCLRNKWISAAIPVGLFIVTVGALRGGIIATTFFPFIEREEINITLKMASGTPEEITLSRLEQIEEAVWKTNEQLKAERADGKDVVLAVDRRLGPSKSSEGSVRIKLLDNENRNTPVLRISEIIRQNTGPMSGVEEYSFGDGGPFGKPISIAIKGTDQERVRNAVDKLKERLKKLSDLKDVSDDDLEGLREITLKLKDKAFLLGLNEQVIMSQVRSGFFGAEVQRIQRGLDEVKVWVRYTREQRGKQGSLAEMTIRTPTGQQIPLRELADFEISRGVVAINHTDGQRQILVQADIANSEVSVTDVLSTIDNTIIPEVLANYPELHYSFEGQSREQRKTAASAARVGPIVLLLMLSIIVLTFRSFSQTAAVLMLFPFSFIGVAWGHWLHHIQLSLFSYLGMIALIGIIVNDTLVFINAYNSNIKAGISVYDAVRDAAISRFRPILLTSVTTVAGLAPLMLETSLQAQFLKPMAATLAYGLGFSTVLVLVLLPVILLGINQLKRFISWYWNGTWPDPKEVEPAFKEMKYE
ncbi:MAG: hypothetical protein Kow0075_08410 [Salibacteraceae bacterium]